MTAAQSALPASQREFTFCNHLVFLQSSSRVSLRDTQRSLLVSLMYAKAGYCNSIPEHTKCILSVEIKIWLERTLLPGYHGPSVAPEITAYLWTQWGSPQIVAYLNFKKKKKHCFFHILLKLACRNRPQSRFFLLLASCSAEMLVYRRCKRWAWPWITGYIAVRREIQRYKSHSTKQK